MGNMAMDPAECCQILGTVIRYFWKER